MGFYKTVHDGKCCKDCRKGQFLTWYLVLVEKKGWTASRTISFRSGRLLWRLFGITEFHVDFHGWIPFTLQASY